MNFSKYITFSLLGLLYFSFLSLNAYASVEGLYAVKGDGSIKLKLSKGTFHVWAEEDSQRLNMQIGKYKVQNKRIYFYPEINNIPDLGNSVGEITGKCTIKWEGDVFVKRNCGSRKSKTAKDYQATNHKSPQGSLRSSFPTKWRTYRTETLEISVPEGAKIKTSKEGIKISFRGSIGEILAVEDTGVISARLARDCRPESVLSKGNSRFFICGDKSDFPYIQTVTKGNQEKIFSYVMAKDISSLKALSIALSSIKLKKLASDSKDKKVKNLSYTLWQPRDGSFSVKVPENWEADGGTADFGRNGYIRIIRVVSPDKKEGLLGVYYPFYQFIQMGGITSGIMPMGSEEYIKNRFFYDLARNYKITFDDLQITRFQMDNKLTKELNESALGLVSQGYISGSIRYEAFTAKGTFTFNGEKREMHIFGIMAYNRMPFSQGTDSYVWGPSPIIVTATPVGEFPRWNKVFWTIVNSWQVNQAWQKGHLQYARKDAQLALKHFRKISSIIRRHEEQLNASMDEWDKQQNFEMEIFYDTFHALGGEERYDNPNTGEEIDVPTGADKYFYDQYSQSWVGVKMDKPDANEFIQKLKEKGFVELTPHKY